MKTETKRTVRGIIAIALLMLAVGVGVYFATRTRPVPVAPGASRQPVATAPQPESIAPPPETPPSVPAKTVQPVAEPARHDLIGTWQLSVEDEDGVLSVVGHLLVTQTGNELTASLKEGGAPIAISLDGMKLHLGQEAGAGGQVKYAFDGVLDPAYMQANGTFEVVTSPSDENQPEVRNKYTAHLVRVTDEVLKMEQRDKVLEAKRVLEAKTIFAALQQFASRNDGQFPSSLSQLSRGDLPDPSLVAPAPGRRIAYTGSGQGRMDPEDVKAVQAEFKAKADSRENLIECERRLREVWGSDVPASGSVLHIEYDNPAFTIDVRPSGAISSRGPGFGEAIDANLTPAMIEAFRASESNNLKQLMLVIKMFGNEHNDFIPGGWLTVYPEYLSDPNILHSPWAPEGTVSYDLLFPGETEQRLEELALQLVGSGVLFLSNPDPSNPALRPLLQSMIPTIVAQDMLPADPRQPPARAIAFLDGHVEFVPLAEWDTRIAPFLR